MPALSAELPRRGLAVLVSLAGLAAAAGASGCAGVATTPSPPIAPAVTAGALPVVTSCLVAPRPEAPRRTLLAIDPVAAARVAGTWRTPQAGDALLGAGPSAQPGAAAPPTWTRLEVGADGWFRDEALQNSWACVTVDVEGEQIALLHAVGDSVAFVNGTPRAGDPYENGLARLPIRLVAGRNELLFLCGKPELRVELQAPAAPLALDAADGTLPDLVAGQEADTWGAVLVVNARTEPAAGLAIEATCGEPGGPPTMTPLGPIPPLGVRKQAFRVRGSAPAAPGTTTLALRLLAPAGAGAAADAAAPVALSAVTLPLAVRGPDESRNVTFVSDIDGSVQSYALQPPVPSASPAASRPALFLSLHGAGVDARGHLQAGSAKAAGLVVAPTNRRPYGFDWEDWGRLDALEVLADVERRFPIDRERTYLLGHSMGGHGTWQLGALYPDRFAAIGPSAGWCSFWSYAGAGSVDAGDPVAVMLRRAVGTSDTAALLANLRHTSVFILHGDADDNVPATEARAMRDQLTVLGVDFQYHEQPGAGHWWDASPAPGTDCVDYAPMFEFFAQHRRPVPDTVAHIDFTTVNPQVSSTCDWLTIEDQEHALLPSRVDIQCVPGTRTRFTGTTENVRRLRIDAAGAGGTAEGEIAIQLDGDALSVPGQRLLQAASLQREGGHWTLAPRVDRTSGHPLKGPERYGPFRQAFQHRMQFVYGTCGTPEENAWAADRARFDAETFWYRGNGSVDVLPDTAFDPAAEPERNVILYGHADSHRAWAALLGDSPVQVRRGEVVLGERVWRGADLGCLFVRPRPGSERSMVAVVGGTGAAGLRLTDHLPMFLSGTGVPDCLVLGPEVLASGTSGVRAAGFFGSDWSVAGGDFVLRD